MNLGKFVYFAEIPVNHYEFGIFIAQLENIFKYADIIHADFSTLRIFDSKLMG